MESVWYYVVNGAQVGPVSLAEVKAAADAGKLAPTDLVWEEGSPDWVAARTISGLFSAAPPPKPSGPPRPTYSLSPPSPPNPSAPLALDPEPLALDDAPRPRSHPRRADGAPAELPEWVKLAQVFLRRVVSADLSQMKPEPAEDEALARAGVMDATSRKLAVWRRAVLFVAAAPCAFAAFFALIALLAMDKDEKEIFSTFGMFLLYVQALALVALPAAAILGALAYDRLATSAQWVLIGGLVSFLIPLAVVFVPGDWMIELKTTGTTTVQQLEEAKANIRLILGVVFYLMIVPTVLSLLPAVSRACVRLKLLLPESIVPGWGLVASSPLCVVLTLTTFVLLYHLAGNMLLLLGLLLWIGAPLVYFTKFDLLTRPVSSPADRAVLARTSLIVFAFVALGVFLLFIYLFSVKIPPTGKTLVGFDESTSFLRPWDLNIHKRLIEYIGRSLFFSVFFCDLLLRMMLSVWREERAFAGSEQSSAFDRTMSGLGSAILPRGSAAPAP